MSLQRTRSLAYRPAGRTSRCRTYALRGHRAHCTRLPAVPSLLAERPAGPRHQRSLAWCWGRWASAPGSSQYAGSATAPPGQRRAGDYGRRGLVTLCRSRFILSFDVTGPPVRLQQRRVPMRITVSSDAARPCAIRFPRTSSASSWLVGQLSPTNRTRCLTNLSFPSRSRTCNVIRSL